MLTPVTTLVLKPEVGVAVTVYLPGCKSEITKLPSVPVVNCFSAPVASFFTVTVVPPMTPPLGSTTVPVSLPVVAWAITDPLKIKTIVISASANAPKSVSVFAIGELCISCLLNKVEIPVKRKIPNII